MNSTGLRSAAWWLLVFAFVGGTVLGLVLGLKDHAVLDNVGIGLPLMAYGLVGVLVSRRRPDNPVGWVFLTVGALAGLFAGATAVAAGLVGSGAPPTPAQLAAFWVASSCFYPMMLLATTFTALLYPDGLQSHRWRPVLWLAIGSTAGIALWAALKPVLWGTLRGAEVVLANPFSPFPPVANETWLPPFLLTMMGGVVIATVAAVISMVLRYRRSAGVQRLQMRWFALAVGLLAGFAVLATLVPSLDESFGLLFFLFLAFVPVACGIAILRHGLYEIDRIISRTVAYALVTGTVVAVYALVVTTVTRVLPGSSDVAVAVATLAAAAAVHPVLGRVQGRVDRRFNRARYDAERTIDAYVARLREGVDAETATADLLIAVQRTLQPAATGVWLWGGGT